jgi:phage terminase small subunit
MRVPKMARKLTMRQHKFAVEYVANGGNGTQAAKAAGYGEAGAHVLASNTLRNAKVQQVIAQAEARIIRRIEVTPAKVMGDLGCRLIKPESQSHGGDFGESQIG